MNSRRQSTGRQQSDSQDDGNQESCMKKQLSRSSRLRCAAGGSPPHACRQHRTHQQSETSASAALRQDMRKLWTDHVDLDARLHRRGRRRPAGRTGGGRPVDEEPGGHRRGRRALSTARRPATRSRRCSRSTSRSRWTSSSSPRPATRRHSSRRTRNGTATARPLPTF